jgi:ATP-dependent RNA helicase DDX54/DBP10
MPVTAKRKRMLGVEETQEDVPSSIKDSFDISLALLGKRPKFSQQAESDSDGDLSNFIRTSIATRSIKEGTRIIKKAIGKEKVAKGEVGGGSFQSMGKWPFMNPFKFLFC